jgi:hypothetical protein
MDPKWLFSMRLVMAFVDVHKRFVFKELKVKFRAKDIMQVQIIYASTMTGWVWLVWMTFSVFVYQSKVAVTYNDSVPP